MSDAVPIDTMPIDTVLIVDDSLTVRMDLSDAFGGGGFSVLSCATIAEARSVIATARPSVIVLDVLLPDGDGVDLLREVRNSDQHPIVLMLSQEAQVKDRLRGLQTGADEYVGKPYDRGYVVSKARALLRRGARAPVEPSVLIIDDSLTYREELRRVFSSAGYTVLVAASGEEGLRMAADRRPSAIVVDGQLPGMDGASVIRSVRLDAALRGAACLMLTGSEDRGAELRALDAGADDFIRKEEDTQMIVAKLGATLRRKGPGHGSHAASLGGPRKILAVDDSPTYLHTLADALRSDGYDVVLGRSGEEAIDLLAVQAVDCVLLDLMMPGMGGAETCRRIKAAPAVREIPLIVLTAVEDRVAMFDSLAAGADDYISKSADLDVLRARVRAQLRRKQFEDENRHIREELLRRELEATEARAAHELAETRARLATELELKNRELEAFSYSVSHDLRSPLRAVDGFAQALLEEYGASLDDIARSYLARITTGAKRMGELIEDLLQLSRLPTMALDKTEIDLAAIARDIGGELARRDPARQVELRISQVTLLGDERLLRTVLENLLGNAWKFTRHEPAAVIEVGATRRDGRIACFVHDNGAGFDMAYAEKLFAPFQRLHSNEEFEGTGIGLATVRRIIHRHGGQVWAEGAPGKGATISFSTG